MHKELYIVKGLPKLSVNSQETGPQPLSLMNTAGFALQTNGWNPQVAQFEGTWSETNLADGRELIAGKDQNVIETMQLTLVASTHAELYERLKALNQMTADARLFFTSDYQLEPVYIKWWAECGAGFQYALIFSIDVVPALVDLNQTPAMDVTLTIEREPYWRPIPPGVQPRVWTAYLRTGVMFDPDFDDYDLANEEVYNYNSIPLDSLTVDVEDCRKSYIDIPPEDIPGDAPALINIDYQNYYAPDAGLTAGILTEMMVARYTRPVQYTKPAPGAYQLHHTNTLQSNPNAGTIGTFSAIFPYSTYLGTNAATAADTGARGRKATCGGSDVKNRVDISYGTATDALRMTWFVDPTAMAGRYAVFLRGGQRGGSLGDQSLYLAYGYNGDDVQTNPVAPQLTDAAPSEFWGVTYMGTVDIPTGAPRLGVSRNTGVTAESTSIFTLNLWGSRSTGSSTLYIQDLILMPVDEATLTLVLGDIPTAFAGLGFYDNTGYLLHGALGESAGSGAGYPEVRGSDFTLRPGVNNRLYFFYNSYPYLGTYTAGKSSIVSDPGTGNEVEVRIRVLINIVPRWSGIRDV